MRLYRRRASAFVDAARELVAPVPDAVVPGLRIAVRDLDHRDAPGHRTDELAEVTAYAFGLVDPRDAVARDVADRQRLGRSRRTVRVRMRRTRSVGRPGED